MRFITITIFVVAGRLVSLAIAKAVPNGKAGGTTTPLSRHPSFLDPNKSIDLHTISSHGISIGSVKILRGLENYEMNKGMMHPFATKQGNSKSRIHTRGASVPLTMFRNNMWMGEISIDTPPKILKDKFTLYYSDTIIMFTSIYNLTVNIDTGAADMWVLQAGCDGISEDRNLWDPNLSATAGKLGPFQLKYTDGTIVKGDRYVDIATIAGFTAHPMIFNSATSYTSLREYPADGLLALAFPSVSKYGSDPLFEALVEQNSVMNPTFSFKFSSPGVEMYLGGANILENVPAVFDTGSIYIGDWNQVSELYKGIDGTLEELGGFGFYYLPCNSFPTVAFTFDGKTFEIPPEVLRLEPVEEGSLNCFSAIIAQRSPVAEISLRFVALDRLTCPDYVWPSILDHWDDFPGGRI